MVWSHKSTNGRSEAQIPRALRAGVAGLARIAPGLMARVGARAFLTPPRHARPAHDRLPEARAEPFAVRHRGGTLRGWRVGAGPAVVLVHGWGGRAGQLAPIAEALAVAGCTAVAFDAPAHGRSEGRIASIPILADALAAVAAESGARAAVGHSLGGAALAWAMVMGSLTLDVAVVVAPPQTPALFLDRLCEAFALDPRARAALQARIEKQVGLRMEALDLVALASRGRAPLLVLHDRRDAEVPFAHGAALAAAWPGAALRPSDGLGHRRILRDPSAVRAAAVFVVDHLPRCGCGRLASTADGDGDGAEPRCAGCAMAEELWARERRAR